MIDPTDIHSLTDFQRNTRRHLSRLKRTGRPEVLTINGQPAAVVQDPAAYAELLALAAEAREARLLEKAIEEAKAGRGRPAREVIAEIRRDLEAASASSPVAAPARPRVRRKTG